MTGLLGRQGLRLVNEQQKSKLFELIFWEKMRVTKDTPEEMIVQHAGTCPVSNDCKSCGKCCQYGTGHLIDSDMPKIAAFLGITEEELKEKYLEQVEKFHKILWKPKTTKKPFGPCVFYKDGQGCGIHEVKPKQCLTGSWNNESDQLVQWFYLNYAVEVDDPESIRQWASYLEFNPEVIVGGTLEELVPDKEKLKEILGREHG